jgi:hypothetical protein
MDISGEMDLPRAAADGSVGRVEQPWGIGGKVEGARRWGQ